MLDINNLTDKEIRQLNSFEQLLTYKITWHSRVFTHLPHRVIGLFCGNQVGKTAVVAYSYTLRIMGWHPIPEKNVNYFECSKGHKFAPFQTDAVGIIEGKEVKCHHKNKGSEKMCGEKLQLHKRQCKIIRFASESLPMQSEDKSRSGQGAREIKNTQYPEFRKWFPSYFIKKDVTTRNASMVITDPYGGDDIIIEFCSYGQSTQSQAGHQRLSVWIDELAPEVFFDEQNPRLFMESGDLIVSYTPVQEITYYYDKLFEAAQTYYRTDTIINEYYLNIERKKVPQVEHTGHRTGIAIIQAATDDNPVFAGKDIDELYKNIDDPDLLYMRRFGIFKQISGRIFKCFDPRVHIIDGEKLFSYAA